ncbi:MAG: hypothetical protein KAS96_10095 [Planctomycetes bacterium]|nr:hypothetical protein [Planctomycetota bacterium]
MVKTKKQLIELLRHLAEEIDTEVDFDGTAYEYFLWSIKKYNQEHDDNVSLEDIKLTDAQLYYLTMRRYHKSEVRFVDLATGARERFNEMKRIRRLREQQ